MNRAGGVLCAPLASLAARLRAPCHPIPIRERMIKKIPMQ